MKRIITILVVLLTALVLPAHAQFTDGQMGGQDQSMFGPMGPMGPMGQMGDMGQMGMMGPWGQMGDMGQMGPFGSMSSFMPSMPHGASGDGIQSTYVTYRVYDSAKSLMATLEGMPELALFTSALKAGGYDEKLNGNDYYMVFAPPNKAIKRDLSVNSTRALVAKPDLVKGLVENGVVSNPPELNTWTMEKKMTAQNGKVVTFRKEKSGTSVNGADILKIVNAKNGVLIVTDGAVGT